MTSLSNMSAEIELINLHNIGKKRGIELWRVNKFQLESVPKEEFGTFYSGDCYVLLNTKGDHVWDIHFWLGRECSGDERGVAAIMAVHIDNHLGGLPVEYREVQGHESALFLSYFPNGIRYLAGGHESGYRKVQGKRNVRVYQVDCKKESLNQGDVFILDLGRVLYVWMPPKSGRLERIKAMNRAKNCAEVERQGAAKVHIIDDDWNTHNMFWSYFGGKEVIGWIKGHKEDDESYWSSVNNVVSLWRVSDSTGEMDIVQVAEGELKTAMLDSKDAFILDAGKGGVYVWIGKECTMMEREKAMETGAKYLNKRKLPEFTVLTRVLETAEPTSFSQWFSDWSEKKSKKSYEPRLYQVSDESGHLETEEIEQYDQLCLDGDDVMVLDALNLVYVWVGSGATKNERESAEEIAQKFLKESQLPRGKSPKIEVIFQGQEPSTFKKFFPEWDDKLFKPEARSVANMRKLLFK